jgi:hypothetical protein
LNLLVAVVIGAIAVLHVLIDRVKIAVEVRTGPSLVAFLADQGIHVLVVVIGGVFLANEPMRLHFFPPTVLAAVFFVSAGFVFLAVGGSAVTRLVLRRFAISEPEGQPDAGHAIGVLERLIVFVFVLGGQWAAAALVGAVKSLARWESLKERRFAEYYLVGTLTSVFVAILVGAAVRAVI